MKLHVLIPLFLLPCTAVWGKGVPQEAAARLAAIYKDKDKGEYSPRGFDGRWLKDSTYVLWEPGRNGSGRELARYHPATSERTVLVTASQLIPAGQDEPLLVRDYALSADLNRVLIMTNRRSSFRQTTADFWFLDRTSNLLRLLVDGIEPVSSVIRVEPMSGDEFSPDGNRIVFCRAHNLFVQDLRSGKITPLTTNGSVGLVGNGVSDVLGGGAEWSPDGQRIAYVQTDMRPMGQMTMLKTTDALYPEAITFKFPKVGTSNAIVRIGIVSATGGETRWVKVPGDDEGFYLSDLKWAENSDEVIFCKTSRSHDVRELFLANAVTGNTTRIYRETSDTWVAGDGLSRDPGFSWLGRGRAFTWLSEKENWLRAYTVTRDGKTETGITPATLDVCHFAGTDEINGWYYYIASPTNAAQRYLFRTKLDGTVIPERLTPADQPGTHAYKFSPDAKWAFHSYSTFDRPPTYDLIEIPTHKVVRILEDNHALAEKIKSWYVHPAELFTLKIENHVEMDAWMLKPRDFDPARKYPVLIFIYGNPTFQTVLDSWNGPQGNSLFHRTIADQGYLVVSMDNRGTPAPKGTAWRRAVFGSLGPLCIEEQSQGLKELGRVRPYVDLSRVGIWGWSGGGTDTLNALFRKPDQYHVGIAIAPKPKHELYNSWFQEIFMRTPQTNPEGYRTAAALNYAEGLKGDLLIVHGGLDDNSHLQITELLVNRLIELEKPFDYMVYPLGSHDIREGPGYSLHLRMKMAQYLFEHLPAGPR